MLNKSDVIREVKNLKLPLGQYLLLGGASLAVRGIRHTKDLDILLTPTLFAHYQSEGWPLDAEYKNKWHRKRLKKNDMEIYPDLFLEKQGVFLDVLELIRTAEMIEGIPLQSLEHLLMCKLDSARPKDLEDVSLIRAHLVHTRSSKLS